MKMLVVSFMYLIRKSKEKNVKTSEKVDKMHIY